MNGALALRIHERSAAGGDGGVAERQHQAQDLALGGAKVDFAVTREDVGHGLSFRRSDQLVDALRAPSEPLPEQARDGALTGSHEAHEIDLVDRGHNPRAIRWSSSKNRG